MYKINVLLLENKRTVAALLLQNKRTQTLYFSKKNVQNKWSRHGPTTGMVYGK